MPDAQADRAYLGLRGGESFTLSQVGAELVLVEILNTHCSHCQKQTLPFNRLFELIEKDPRTRGRIKMLAVAVGNVGAEVEDFRDIYEVPFPVLADPRFALHRALGGSPTPFAAYVRFEPGGGAGLVAGTHLGANSRYRRLFEELLGLLEQDLSFLRRRGPQGNALVRVEPIVSEEGMETTVRAAFATLGAPVKAFRRVALPSGRRVYAAFVGGEGGERRFFAEAISRPSVCDLCHDVHFVYLFDTAGEVLGFIPLLLTKYGNVHWDDSDIAKLRGRMVGQSLNRPPLFHPEVDAVTTATITSALIFDSLGQGRKLLAELRQEGLL